MKQDSQLLKSALYENKVLEAEVLRLKATNEELLEAVKIALWDLENGEGEAQRQRKPRFTERADIYRKAISNATHDTLSDKYNKLLEGKEN